MTAWTRTSLLRLELHMYYEGPFDRLASWLWALDPQTMEQRHEVGRLRNWLARLVDRADTAWREHYVKADRYPPARWRRKLT